MKVNKNLQPVSIPIEPHNRHIEMTPKEALDFLVKNLPPEAQQTTSIYHPAIRVLLQSITELEELKRDVKRFMELQYKNQFDHMTLNEIHKMYVLREKLGKVGNEE